MLLNSRNASRGKLLNLQIASKTLTSTDTSNNNTWECPLSAIFANTRDYYLLWCLNGIYINPKKGLG